MPDWYAVLAVEPTASVDEIRRAFHVAALKLHPDKNSGASAAEEFDLARQAYSVLTDESKRAEFDASIGIVSPEAAAQRLRRHAEAKRQQQLFAEKLRAQESSAQSSARLDERKNELRREAQLQKEALAELLSSRERDNPNYRTLSDFSHTFDTVDEARQYVDTHPGTSLVASLQELKYTPEYAAQTMERMKRREHRVHASNFCK